MTEEIVAADTILTAPITGMEIITPAANMFSDDAWSSSPATDALPKEGDGGSGTVKSEVKQEVIAPSTDEEIVDEYEHLEKQTGYKTWEEIKAARTELEELRTKVQPTAEIKFANETSQKLFEAWKEGKEDDVYSYLDTKRQLSKAADLPAAEAIKLHLQQTNPHFKIEDVEDVFKERYAVPKKPIQRASEETDEFQERLDEYNERVGMITRAIERDGIAAKQDLAKRITELVPPEIPKAPQANQGPDPKILETLESMRKSYIQKMESEYSNFDGFTVTAKDDSVELPVNYKIDEKDDAEIKQIMQRAVFDKLDVNDYFTDRWFSKDAQGSLVPNINKMKTDFYLLEKTEKILSGVATKGATERRLYQIKVNSNINVTGNKTHPQEVKKDGDAAMLEHFWKS